MSTSAMQAWRDRGCPAATVAVGRFQPGGPVGYRLASDPEAPVRPTREEALSPYVIGVNTSHDGRRSGTLGADGPGGVGSTNRGLTPTTDLTGSEG